MTENIRHILSDMDFGDCAKQYAAEPYGHFKQEIYPLFVAIIARFASGGLRLRVHLAQARVCRSVRDEDRTTTGLRNMRLEKVSLNAPKGLQDFLAVLGENEPSIRIVEANGGQYCDTVFDSRTEHQINRYWVRLKP